MNQGDVATYKTKISNLLDPTDNIYHINLVCVRACYFLSKLISYYRKLRVEL